MFADRLSFTIDVHKSLRDGFTGGPLSPEWPQTAQGLTGRPLLACYVFASPNSSPGPRGSPFRGIFSPAGSNLIPSPSRKRLTSFCNTAWSPRTVGNREVWPGNGAINSTTIPQLDLPRTSHGKWTEGPYAGAFTALSCMPSVNRKTVARWKKHFKNG